MSIFIFLIIYYFLYLFGLSFSQFFIFKERLYFVKNLPNYIFYPIISIFVIGNSSLILNFFLPLNIIIIPLIVSIALFIFFQQKGQILKKLKKINKFEWTIGNLFIPVIISVSLYASRFHFDAAAYHISYQNWLRTEKIAFGLATRNFGFGFSSLLEYLYSLLWLNNNLLYIYSINIVFFIFLLNFVYFCAISNDKFLRVIGVFTIGYLFLDNFGIGGGANGSPKIQTIAKPDMPMSIIFFITSALIINSIKKNKYELFDLKFFTYLIFFCFQIKLNGVLSIFILFFYIFKYSQQKKLRFISLLMEFKTLIILSLLWILKNFILTGCLIFPLKFTCLPQVPWYINGYINEYLGQDLNDSILYANNIEEWLKEFINYGFNYQVLTNFLLTATFLFLSSIIISNKNSKKELFVSVFFVFLIFIWLLTEPKIRWASHIFMFSIFVIINNIEFKNFFNKLINKYTGAIAICVVSLLFPRFYSYQNIFENNFALYILDIPKIEYIENDYNSGVIPINSEGNKTHECFKSKYCMLNQKDIGSEVLFSYKFFYYKGFDSW